MTAELIVSLVDQVPRPRAISGTIDSLERAQHANTRELENARGKMTVPTGWEAEGDPFR